MQTRLHSRPAIQLIAASLPFLLAAADLPAQSDVSRSHAGAVRHFHSPMVAATLGALIPGAGHMYSHEYAPGVSFLVGTVVTFSIGNEIRHWDSCMFALLTACEPDPEPFRSLGLLLMGASIVGWVASAIDAPRAAQRANTEHLQAVGMALVTTPEQFGFAWRYRF